MRDRETLSRRSLWRLIGADVMLVDLLPDAGYIRFRVAVGSVAAVEAALNRRIRDPILKSGDRIHRLKGVYMLESVALDPADGTGLTVARQAVLAKVE